MSIRFLDHSGKSHPLSARLISDFESELRRIGEAPSPPTVNLWVSNQTPEELIQILKRIPDRPAEDGSERDGAHGLQSEALFPENSNKSPAAATVKTKRPDGNLAGHRVKNSASDSRPVEAPHGPMYSEENGWVWPRDRVYNSAYQRETGHIFADPGGDGDQVLVNGRAVNLREEQDRRERRKIGGDKGASAEG